MLVLKPRLSTAAAMMWGFSRGRDDGIMVGFQRWFSQTHLVAGHPNPIAHEVVLAEELYKKRPEQLTDTEETVAVNKLCELVRAYLQLSA